MQLRKVYFDAFKSLLDKELEFTDNCIGLVGKNEAGKSNVLAAIEVLSRDQHLTLSDTPKMKKTRNPALRFELVPNADDTARILEALGQSGAASSLRVTDFLQDCVVTYHVTYNKKSQAEERSFSITGVKLPPDTLVRRFDALTDGYAVKKGDAFVPMSDAVLLTRGDVEANARLAAASKKLSELRSSIAEIRAELAPTPIPEETPAEETPAEETPAEETPAEETPAEEMVKAKAKAKADAVAEATLRKRQEKLEAEASELAAQLGSFDIESLTSKAQREFSEAQRHAAASRESIATLERKIETLQAVAQPDDAQTKELAQAKKSLQSAHTKQERLSKTEVAAERQLTALTEPIAQKYTDDVAELSRHLAVAIGEEWLPKVVFWENSPDYVLSGETDFKDLKGKDLSDISRPLVNLFRIGLNISTKEELESAIQEIRGVDGERSRYEQQMNKNIGRYLKDVWPEYDQDIKVALERERIRVEFYDPKRTGASFYTMEERSQGCKTFISFLLTIGAEAKRGVIKDTVLLLDEPETHLHPSGVRFMLQELIRAAANGNTVVFATHSIFMIDKDKYDRHVIVKKEEEQTTIQPSRRDRIGFFMQEEVLYGALDVRIGKEFDSTQVQNFVFEGDGDVTLFECLYAAMPAKDQPFPAESTAFYHGGKCSDIKKYLVHRPLQMLSKWIFVLDGDQPGQELRTFIENRYKEFLGQCVFVVQYECAGNKVELEDLLPLDVLKQALPVTTRDNAAALSHAEGVLQSGEPIRGCLAQIAAKDSEPDSFSARFKESLNGVLSEKAKDTSAAQVFKTQFPVYFEWASAVLSILAICFLTRVFSSFTDFDNSPSFSVKRRRAYVTPRSEASTRSSSLKMILRMTLSRTDNRFEHVPRLWTSPQR